MQPPLIRPEDFTILPRPPYLHELLYATPPPPMVNTLTFYLLLGFELADYAVNLGDQMVNFIPGDAQRRRQVDGVARPAE